MSPGSLAPLELCVCARLQKGKQLVHADGFPQPAIPGKSVGECTQPRTSVAAYTGALAGPRAPLGLAQRMVSEVLLMKTKCVHSAPHLCQSLSKTASRSIVNSTTCVCSGLAPYGAIPALAARACMAARPSGVCVGERVR
eukprot:scaffold69471_cov28-Tisochrysis_lutea.AAC.1